jgi:hypothetical protein
MGLSIEEIRDSNKKYYYESYFRRVTKMQFYWIVFSISIILLFQYAAYRIICEFIRQGYFEQAKLQSLGIEETGDWVNRKMGGAFFNNVFIIMLMVTLIILVYTIGMYVYNGIHLYRKKRILLWLPAVAFITEILLVAGFNREAVMGDISILGTLILVSFIKTGFEILISGITLPIEVKAPCIKFMNKLFDKALENL